MTAAATQTPAARGDGDAPRAAGFQPDMEPLR